MKNLEIQIIRIALSLLSMCCCLWMARKAKKNERPWETLFAAQISGVVLGGQIVFEAAQLEQTGSAGIFILIPTSIAFFYTLVTIMNCTR